MKPLQKTKLQNQPAAVKGGFDLPSYDALARLLPSHRRPLRRATPALHGAAAAAVHERPPRSPEPKPADKPNMKHTHHVHRPHTRQPQHDPGDDPRLARITSLQNEGIKNYDSALNQMAADVMALRRRVVTVEAENRRLRTEVSVHQDLGHNLATDWDVNSMAKTEVAHLVDSLKRILATETRNAASQRDRIHQRQNDLIKSCGEKERLNLQRVQPQQQQQQQQRRRQEHPQLHQSCSAKIGNLEATVKQQRQIIRKMERALERREAKGVQRKEESSALGTELGGLQQ